VIISIQIEGIDTEAYYIALRPHQTSVEITLPNVDTEALKL